jgi:hypothetical protein
MIYPDTKIETACAIKDIRAQFNQPYYDASASLLVATNGQILAALPTINDADVCGYTSVCGSVPLDAIKRARKMTPRGQEPEIDLSDAEAASVNGATFTRPDETFPDYQAIIHDKAVDVPDICIDAALLKRLSDALHDRNGKDQRIKLYLPRNPDGTIDNSGQIRVEAVDHGERIGLIMPCRI